MRWLVPLLLLLVSSADRPRLLITVQHPAGLDPVGASGMLTVSVMGAATDSPVQEHGVATDSLGSRQSLFEGMDLAEGEVHRVSLEAEFEDGEALCRDSGKLTTLPVWLSTPRAMHQATVSQGLDGIVVTGGLGAVQVSGKLVGKA